MLNVKFQGSIVEYKHKIVPIKCGEVFIPNTPRFEEIQSTSTLNMLESDFKKYQRKGEVILVNKVGGWCTLTKDMEIVN